MFLKLIDICSNFYKLDPYHYSSSPGLRCNVMLKITGVRLEKISNIDMYLFIQEGLRGGISCVCKRHSKANNKYIKNYLTKPSKFILYFDMNNLYDWELSGYHPYCGFKWLKNVDNFAVNSISENSSVGYILEIDLQYP